MYFLTDEQYTFIKHHIWAAVPLVGVSVEVSEARDTVADRIAATRTASQNGDGHLSDRQKDALGQAIDAQAARGVNSVEDRDEILLELQRVLVLRQLFDAAIPDLRDRLTAARAPLADALALETDTLARFGGLAEGTIDEIADQAGVVAADAEVQALENMRGAFAGEIARRAGALAELGADALNAAAGKLGLEQLTDLVAMAHPPVAGVLDDSAVSLDELASVLHGSLGGDVALLADLLENGCGRDPGKLKDIATAFPNGSDDQKNLAALMKTGGFADNPRALGAVFAIGCNGAPDQLKAFAAAFAGDEPEQKRLAALIDDGGLGGAPEALGHVIASGGAAAVKDLGAAFNSGPDLVKLKSLVEEGGMGGASARSPDALAKMLENGVADAAALKVLHDDFGANGMDDLRAMVAALDLRPPGTRDPGTQFAHVAAKVGSPPANMKTEFYDVIDKSARGAACRTLIQDSLRHGDIQTMLDATAGANDAETKGVRDAAMGGALALSALDGVPGVDAGQVQLLKDAIAAAGRSATVARDMVALTGDVDAARGAAEATLREGRDDAAYLVAAGQAKDEATAAKAAATLAANALTAANPKTKDLIEAAEDAATEALAKAKACPDDAERAATVLAAKACLDAVKAAMSAVSNATVAAAGALAATEAKAGGGDAQAGCGASAPLRRLTHDAKATYQDAVANGLGNPAEANALAAWQAAQANEAAADAARDAGLGRMDEAADNAAQLRLTAEALAHADVLAAQGEAQRLAKLAQAPGASDADRQAAREAEGAAAKLLADKAIASAGTAVTGLESPGAAPATIKTIARSSGDALYDAAIKLKAAMSSALACREARLDALRAQMTLAARARALADKPDASQAESDAADAAEAKVVTLKADLDAAQVALDGLVTHARDLDKKVNKNLKVQIRHHAKCQADGDAPGVISAQKDEMEAAQAAAAICAAVAKRSHSASFPAMSRDDLIATASTMNKSNAGHLSATDHLPGKLEADTLHFCGRHTREFFGFEGRDFFDDKWLLDEAIKRATEGDTNFNFPINQMKTTSLWPVGFGAAEVTACLQLAVAAVNARPEVLAEGDLRTYLDNVAAGNERFSGVPIVYNGDNYTVNIAFRSKGAAGGDPNVEIGQFVPTSTPSVPFFDMHAIKAAMKY